MFAMGAWDAGEGDPLGINQTLKIAEQVPGMKAIGVADPMRTDAEHFRKVEAIGCQRCAWSRLQGISRVSSHLEPAHPNYRRYYELAAKYNIPVMFHTGDTYSPQAKLKYAQPLGVDDVAVDHPNTRFVICHIGNPWTIDAAEVIYKNMNVWGDLSGLMVGTDEVFISDEGREAKAEMCHAIQKAIRYSERPNRFVYGTDWPLAPDDFCTATLYSKCGSFGLSRTRIRPKHPGIVPDVIRGVSLLLKVTSVEWTDAPKRPKNRTESNDVDSSRFRSVSPGDSIVSQGLADSSVAFLKLHDR